MKLDQKIMLGAGIFIVLGSALLAGFTIKGRELEKYDVAPFSTRDSLKTDTALVKKSELQIDTLIDYSEKSREDIKLKASRHGYTRVYSTLSVYNKKISKYKLLENNVLSKKIIKEKNKTRHYHLIGDVIGKNFKIDKFELHSSNSNATLNLLDSPSINNIYPKNTTHDTIYTWGLDSLKTEVIGFFNKIEKHKKKKGSWKD